MIWIFSCVYDLYVRPTPNLNILLKIKLKKRYENQISMGKNFLLDIYTDMDWLMANKDLLQPHPALLE